MRLSVVITNHNYARFLPAAVASAAAQTYGDTEVIVVDDGSTDDSERVLSALPPGITVLRQRHAGQGAAFNAGLRQATGDVVMFLDADDRLQPDVGQRVMALMRADQEVVRVQFLLRLIDADGRWLGSTLPARAAELSCGDLRARLEGHPDDVPWQPTSGNAFRRTALDRIFPMPDEPYRICADYYLSNLVPWLGRVGVLARPGGDYRLHPDNGEYSEALVLDRLRANLLRTVQTHRAARAVAACVRPTSLPEDPWEVRSVTFMANRLISLRLDRRTHPRPGDTRWGLLRRGVLSSCGRFDLSWPARLARSAWFVVLALCPARAVGAVVHPYVRRASLGRAT